jgi:uncharacterized protein YndB with AHSA1/START domain
MDRPMESPLVHEESYSALISQVWEALTDEADMRNWYFPQLINFKPEVGFDFVFTNDGCPYQKAWQVTQVEEGKILAHSWMYKGYPGKSEVIFKLFVEGEKRRT